MKRAMQSCRDFLLLKLHRTDPFTLFMNSALTVLLLASLALCWISILPDRTSSSASRQQNASHQPAPAGNVNLSEIDKEIALLQDSIDRAHTAAIASGGRSPFLYEAEEAQLEEPVAVYAEPPLFRVRELMLSGRYKSAIVEIGNHAAMEHILVGSQFDEGRGKVTAIDEEGVSWLWCGTRYRSTLSS